jgi:predicted nucleic acid-binding protein
MGRCFVDTNVVIYANDRTAGAKQARAIELITSLMRGQNGVLSVQVLQEYANTALGKLGQEASVVLRQLRHLERLRVVAPSPAMVRRAVEIRNSYQIGFWDASIIAAAESADCTVILSEDLSSGQFYAGIEVANPFTPGFELARYTE